MSQLESKPVQDWNIEAAEAMRVLGEIRRRDDIKLSPEEDAALGAGRLALLLLLPGKRDRAKPEMVENALLGCPKHVQEAMSVYSTPKDVTAWMIQRAMVIFVDHFNKYRKPRFMRMRRQRPDSAAP